MVWAHGQLWVTGLRERIGPFLRLIYMSDFEVWHIFNSGRRKRSKLFKTSCIL